MAITTKEELLDFVQNEVDFIKQRFLTTIRATIEDHNKFLRFEVNTKYYNMLEDFLRGKKIVNAQNWQGMEVALKNGLATFESFQYYQDNNWANRHLFFKSVTFFEELYVDIINLINQIDEVCRQLIIPTNSEDEIKNLVNQINFRLTDLINRKPRKIDYEGNFEKFYGALQIEYPLQINDLKTLKEMSNEVRTKLEERSSITETELVQYFGRLVEDLLRVVIDSKMTIGFEEPATTLVSQFK